MGAAMSDRVTLLPPSATNLERSLDLAGARIGEIPVPIGALWSAETCPENALAWLAWSLSVDEWDGRWPVDVRRAITAQSIQVHRVKGTVGAVRRALAAVDADSELQEWFDLGTDPHTFRLTITPRTDLAGTKQGVLFSDALVSELRRVVDAAKPVRSHYEVRLRASGSSALHVASGAVLRARSQIDVHSLPPRIAGKSSFIAGSAGVAVSRGSARFNAVSPKIAGASKAFIASGGAARQRSVINFTGRIAA